MANVHYVASSLGLGQFQAPWHLLYWVYWLKLYVQCWLILVFRWLKTHIIKVVPRFENISSAKQTPHHGVLTMKVAQHNTKSNNDH